MYKNMGAENGRILLPREGGAVETRVMLKGPAQWEGAESLVLSCWYGFCILYVTI